MTTSIKGKRFKRQIAKAVYGYSLVKDGIDGPYFPTLTLDGNRVNGVVYVDRAAAQKVAVALGSGRRVVPVALCQALLERPAMAQLNLSFPGSEAG